MTLKNTEQHGALPFNLRNEAGVEEVVLPKPMKPSEVGERSAEILKVGIKHEAVMTYMLMNPLQKLSQVAAHFGVTQAWLSTVIHSDAFQAKLRDRQDEIFVQHVMPIQVKLRAVADLAVTKLGDCVERSVDPDYILNVSDKVLHRLGFAPKSVAAQPSPAQAAGVINNIQQNTYVGNVTKETLARAREAQQKMLSSDPLPALEGEKDS